MGICYSRNVMERYIANRRMSSIPKCFICSKNITQVNYITCNSCKKDMHLNCFKTHTKTMTECHICSGSDVQVTRSTSIKSSKRSQSV